MSAPFIEATVPPPPTTGSCIFTLRRDGLGNRLEQIMNLNLSSDSTSNANSTGTGDNQKLLPILLWPSWSNGRGSSYSGVSEWIKVDGAILLEENDPQTKTILGSKLPTCPWVQDAQETKNRQRIRNCRRIRPNFNISFPITLRSDDDDDGNHGNGHVDHDDNNYFALSLLLRSRPVGVHIRKSDRLQRFHRVHGTVNDFTTPDELQNALEYMIRALTRRKPLGGVFIASDDDSEKVKVQQRLANASIRIVEPLVVSSTPNSNNNINNNNNNNKNVPPFLVDFFALTQCSEIWMVSSFSSFAVMASRIPLDVPLYSLLPPQDTNLGRYGVPDLRPFPVAFAWPEEDDEALWKTNEGAINATNQNEAKVLLNASTTPEPTTGSCNCSTTTTTRACGGFQFTPSTLELTLSLTWCWAAVCLVCCTRRFRRCNCRGIVVQEEYKQLVPHGQDEPNGKR